MEPEPTLLFLHGIGTGDKDDEWKAPFVAALTRTGYPVLDEGGVIAPKYAHALKGWDNKVPLPPVTIKQPSREMARKNRRDFERRIGAVEFRLGRHDAGGVYMGGDQVVGAAVGFSPFKQARNYLNDPQIRAQVLRQILETLPESGRLVIVGHSLGSVIAADLLNRLPPGIEVVGMVTIGSPLANGSFDVDKLRETLKEPPANLQWWVNFWDVLDPVAAHRGVSSVFPWMVDFRISTKAVGLRAHAASNYLADESVAEAIGYALFGSTSRELVAVDRGLDIPLDVPERLALIALRYAHHLRSKLAGDQLDRFAGAMRQVQAAVVDDIRRRNDREKRGMPSAVARLAFDLSDSHAVAPEPLPVGYITKDEAVVLLTVLASENVIRPFEIAIPRDKWQSAMEDLSAEMGLGSRYGADVFESAKRAQAVLSGGRGFNWMKWGALGVGAAAIIVATGGLALAAAPGLAGAAAIVSALASFGPGGMIGGLLTAGSLVTAGGGGIALGLAGPGTSAKTLEAVIARQLAAVILRQLQRLDPDPAVWRNLVETEIEVRREYERLDELSDESAPTLAELKRKIDAVERALTYLRENGLEPGLTPDASFIAD